MEKENASAPAERDKDRPAPNLLDAASLFGGALFSAYTGAYGGLLGRPGTPATGGFAGAANPYGTLSVAASQAANLGINPASAAWWNMASQIAAHDYLASLQFAGLTPNMIPPYPMISTPPHLSTKTNHSKSSSSSSTPPSVPTSSLPPTTTSNDNLLGVKLPPDTEIIKYTSSMVGPKIPGTTNRGRKKTISLDVPHLGHHSQRSKNSKSYSGLDLSGKSKEAASVEDSLYRYGMEADRAELIKLSQTNGRTSPVSQPDDGPLNLSLKPDMTNHNNNNSALQSLSALSQNLGQSERVDRRKPGPKPRRIPPFTASESSHPSSGSEENDASVPHKDGRPRNLGRGVSKPKKNTVASLLAQSRALGLKPGLEISQLAALAKSASNYENNKDESNVSGSPNSLNDHLLRDHPLLNFGRGLEDHGKMSVDGMSDDSHSELSDTTSESEGERKRNRKFKNKSNDGGPGGKRRKVVLDETKLREAIDKGWKRETYIKSVGRLGINGEVIYTSPCGKTFRHLSEIVRFLEKQGSDLSRDHFTFSCRILLGEYIESGQGGKEPVRLTEEALALKLQELVTQHSLSLFSRASLDQNKHDRDRMAFAAKEAKRLAREEAAKQKEHLRLLKEQERSERQEQARKEREQRSQQLLEERELKRQQAAIIKEQERERRRQHMGLVKALEVRKRMEEREKKRLEQRAEKLATREKRIEQRKIEVELLRELRKPVEDMELTDAKPLPNMMRIPGLKLSGQAFSDALLAYEFLRNFGETLGFDPESLPSLNSLQDALLGASEDAEDELLSVITQLVICGIEDPGIPQPARHTTILNHSLKQADISHSNLTEILRIYLYANATGELKATTGVHFEREREKRVTEHHNNMNESVDESGKNSAFFTLLKENQTYKMSEWLKKRPFLSLNPTKKAAILAFLCHELLQNKAVIRQIDSAIDTVAQLKRERWPIEANLRKLKHIQARKNKGVGTSEKPDAPNDEEGEVESCNESDITQPDEDELARMNIGETLAVVSKQSEVNTKALADYSSQLRSSCLGQDRFCRRYWCLSTGIYVEAIESGEPELFYAPEAEVKEEEEEDEKHDESVDIKSEPDEEHDETVENDEKMEIETEPKVEIKEEIKEEKETEKARTPTPSITPTPTPPRVLQFEKLGECMEKESNAMNGVHQNSHHDDAQWFSILPKDPCDSTSITNSQPGYRYWSESNELRIPQPQYGSPSPCPSPLPLPLSAEEVALLEHCKTHGLPKPGKVQPIPPDLRRGWWKISMAQMKEVLAALEPRGVREREFMASITRLRTDHTWDSTLLASENGDPTKSDFKVEEGQEEAVPDVDDPDEWNQETAVRIDLAALVQVESLEEKVASASMQIKGWKVPPKATASDVEFQPACIATDPSLNPVAVAKERLSQLFDNIEKRYLKPPLGTNTGDLKLAASCNNVEEGEASRDCKGLVVWKEALHKSQTAAQLSMVQHALELSIAWDKSIMKAVSPPQNAPSNCQFCRSGDNEDKLLLCDGCDKGYHTYCFKPKMENIPEGDWFCHQCLNKAKGEKNCIVCGKKVGRNLLSCEACPIAYHTDCMTPPLNKVPRGKWYCANCATKHAKKKTTRRSHNNSLSPTKPDELTNSTESLHTAPPPEEEAPPPPKKEKSTKRLSKDLAPCHQLLDELQSHDEAWPFLAAVNTKQFPTYKKIIRNPMDLQTISKRLSHNEYKCKEDFVSDVRLIFDNCETFNEDNSPVGKAGHSLRLYFETRWAELTGAKIII